MAGYYSGVCAHWFDDVDHVRLRERQWRQRDGDQRRHEQQREKPDVSSSLLADAIRFREAGHVTVSEKLGFNIERVEVTSDLRGYTRGVIHDGTGLGAIAAMITIAAGKAAQRKLGARAECFNKWCADDDRKMIDIALCLVSEKDAAVKLIMGAERVAEDLVDQCWDEIGLIARALERMGGVLERDSIKRFLRDMPRIDLRLLSRGEPSFRSEPTVDGKIFRWREDGGHLKPIAQ
jgi:hypothetical protein